MSQVGAEVVHHDVAVHTDGGRQSCVHQGEGAVLNIVSKNFMIRISKQGPDLIDLRQLLEGRLEG